MHCRLAVLMAEKTQHCHWLKLPEVLTFLIQLFIGCSPMTLSGWIQKRLKSYVTTFGVT